MGNSTADSGIAKNIFVGYFVIILHVLLLLLLGVTIVFFRGVVTYMPWILGGGFLLLFLSGLWFYQKVKKGQINIKQTLRDGVPKNRPVEISFLGGLASMRLGSSYDRTGGVDAVQPPLQLEDAETSRLRSLDRLMEMYNKELITKEEFALLKQDVLHNCGSSENGLNDGDGVIDVDFTSQ